MGRHASTQSFHLKYTMKKMFEICLFQLLAYFIIFIKVLNFVNQSNLKINNDKYKISKEEEKTKNFKAQDFFRTFIALPFYKLQQVFLCSNFNNCLSLIQTFKSSSINRFTTSAISYLIKTKQYWWLKFFKTIMLYLKNVNYKLS